MTSINILALQKQFSFKRWSFLGAFFPKYIDSKSILTIQGVLKNGKYHEMGFKLRYIKTINHMGNLFWESNYIDGSHISRFLAHFIAFSVFRTPCTLFPCILGQNVRKQTPPQTTPYYGGSVFIHFAAKCF